MTTAKTINVLSIDARNGPDGWSWNARYKVGTCDLSVCDLAPSAIIEWAIAEGYLGPNADETNVYVEDDNYNVVLSDVETGEPLYALEYGPACD